MVEYYSFSQLSLYLTCPRKYLYRYIMNLTGIPSGVMITGQAVHRGLEYGYSKKIYTYRDEPTEDVVGIFADSMEQSRRTSEINWGETSFGKELDVGSRLIRKYQTEIAPTVFPTHVELTLTAKVPNVSKPFMGIIDLTDQQLIIDHKVKQKSPTEKRIHDDLQFSAYAYLMWKAAKGETIEPLTETERAVILSRETIPMRVDCLIKTKEIKILQIPTTRTPADVKRFLFVLRQFDHAIQNKVFMPTGNMGLCNSKYCTFYDLCQKET